MEILRYFNLVSITRHNSAMALPPGKRRLEDVSCETSCFEMGQLLDICGFKYILKDEICVSLQWAYDSWPKSLAPFADELLTAGKLAAEI